MEYAFESVEKISVPVKKHTDTKLSKIKDRMYHELYEYNWYFNTIKLARFYKPNKRSKTNKRLSEDGNFYLGTKNDLKHKYVKRLMIKIILAIIILSIFAAIWYGYSLLINFLAAPPHILLGYTIHNLADGFAIAGIWIVLIFLTLVVAGFTFYFLYDISSTLLPFCFLNSYLNYCTFIDIKDKESINKEIKDKDGYYWKIKNIFI